MPRKIASMKNAKPSSENGRPITPPAKAMKRGKRRPKLEADDRPRDGANGEEDGERLGPAPGQGSPDRVAVRRCIASRHEHHQREPHAEHAKVRWKASDVPICARRP
jgi:hypothetical protein